MGRRHRVQRAKVKAALCKNGWYENEFGELKKKVSKSEARRRILAAQRTRRQIEAEIIDRATREAVNSICAEEDARILAELAEMCVPYEARQKIIAAVTGMEPEP